MALLSRCFSFPPGYVLSLFGSGSDRFSGFLKVVFQSSKQRQVREDVNQLGGFTLCGFYGTEGGWFSISKSSGKLTMFEPWQLRQSAAEILSIVDPLFNLHGRILGALKVSLGCFGVKVQVFEVMRVFCHRFYYLLPFLWRPEWCFSEKKSEILLLLDQNVTNAAPKKDEKRWTKTRFIRPRWTPTPT